MMRLTKLTDYGIALMTWLARRPVGERTTARDLAEVVGLPQPTVSKLLKLLNQGDLLVSRRGAAGGYGLARAPEEITLVDIVQSLEGPLSLTECTSSEGCSCALEVNCELRTNWHWINRRFLDTLSGVTLDRMAGTLSVEDDGAAAATKG